MAGVTPIHGIGSLLPWLDTAGLAVFAVSGVLVAVRKRVDFVGACFFALVTAVGGGTLRDLLIGAPVFWIADQTPVPRARRHRRARRIRVAGRGDPLEAGVACPSGKLAIT